MDIARLEDGLATLGGLGRIRIAPGTLGSLVAVLGAMPLHLAGGPLLVGLAGLAALALGNWVAGAYARRIGRQDPREVVIDELAAQWLVLACVPFTAAGAALGFGLFRLFDILKPWPISWVNRHIHGGVGIMLDDILAAAAAVASYWLIDITLMA